MHCVDPETHTEPGSKRLKQAQQSGAVQSQEQDDDQKKRKLQLCDVAEEAGPQSQAMSKEAGSSQERKGSIRKKHCKNDDQNTKKHAASSGRPCAEEVTKLQTDGQTRSSVGDVADVPQGSLQHDKVDKSGNDAWVRNEGECSRQQHRKKTTDAEDLLAEVGNSDDDSLKVVGDDDPASDEATWDVEFRLNPCEEIEMTAEEIRRQDAELGIAPWRYRNGETPYRHLAAAVDDTQAPTADVPHSSLRADREDTAD